MSRQPALKHSWNTMVTSLFWDMRLSIACAATDAEYQNRIILHDNTLNLPVVAQQPHPDPNYASHTAASRRAALPAHRGPALACRSLVGELHAAVCPACCTALYLTFFINF